jgi:HSP20 family protein
MFEPCRIPFGPMSLERVLSAPAERRICHWRCMVVHSLAMFKVSSSLQFVSRAPSARDPESSTESCWVPNTDLYATEEGLVIKVELAGMRKEDLELTVEGSKLRISGQRQDGCRSPQCKFLVMEINYGPFESVIELPAGYDVGRARAAYQNGFLRVDVPLDSKAAKNRRVPGGQG